MQLSLVRNQECKWVVKSVQLPTSTCSAAGPSFFLPFDDKKHNFAIGRICTECIEHPL